eukprot:COSAG05_NODE_1524_length_4640_cov_21.220656_5_plen_96_part_00
MCARAPGGRGVIGAVEGPSPVFRECAGKCVPIVVSAGTAPSCAPGPRSQTSARRAVARGIDRTVATARSLCRMSATARIRSPPGALASISPSVPG